ncbi:hypothetical protein JYG50_25230, partial [Escherichia fergusonii]|uniref:hypothetical protein n=1 Tax=Escherichia fergusonii TaxID=564 RepID=UPI001CBD8B98
IEEMITQGEFTWQRCHELFAQQGLMLQKHVPIRYLEIIISVDMDEYKNIYVISQKHTGLREV